MNRNGWLIIFSLAVLLTLDLNASAACVDGDWRCQAMESYQAADAELNKVYRGALAVIDEYGLSQKETLALKQQLRKSQRLWIQFRDTDCESVYYLWKGGSGMSSAHTDCLTHHTRDRIDSLKAIYEMD